MFLPQNSLELKAVCSCGYAVYGKTIEQLMAQSWLHKSLGGVNCLLML